MTKQGWAKALAMVAATLGCGSGTDGGAAYPGIYRGSWTNTVSAPTARSADGSSVQATILTASEASGSSPTADLVLNVRDGLGTGGCIYNVEEALPVPTVVVGESCPCRGFDRYTCVVSSGTLTLVGSTLTVSIRGVARPLDGSASGTFSYSFTGTRVSGS